VSVAGKMYDLESSWITSKRDTIKTDCASVPTAKPHLFIIFSAFNMRKCSIVNYTLISIPVYLAHQNCGVPGVPAS